MKSTDFPFYEFIMNKKNSVVGIYLMDILNIQLCSVPLRSIFSFVAVHRSSAALCMQGGTVPWCTKYW